MSQEDQAKPGVGKYILAWIIASVLAWPIGAFSGAIVVANERDPLEINAALLATIVGVIALALGIAVWIFVYSRFQSLDVSAVIPWMWGLGLVGVVMNVVRDITYFGGGLFVFLSSFLWYGGALAISVLTFRFYFKRIGRL